MVPRKVLWSAIRRMGIPQEIIVVVQKMYENSEAQMKVGNRISTSFRTTKGLKQGCRLSPTLIKIYLENVLYNWNNKCRNKELPIGVQTMHHHLFCG
jgi:hypothetical protein